MSKPYKSVRALGRGIALLQTLNELGGARPSALAKAADIDRTTAYRLLATLEEAGLVRQAASSDEFVLTERVRTLSEGFTARDRATQIVTTHLGTLFPKVLWPTDFATFENGAMVIRETTHRFSPYSVHRAMVGKPRPMLTSALGRAALAGANDAQRQTILDICRGKLARTAMAERQFADQVAHVLADYERRGYGWSVGGTEGKISAIGVPVRTGRDAAAINLVFFSSAMTVETAVGRFLEPLRECARLVEADLAQIESSDQAAAKVAIPAIQPGIGR